MKKASSSRTSRTGWKRVKSMKDRDIKVTPEHPELDVKHIARVIVRTGLKPVEAKKSISRMSPARERAAIMAAVLAEDERTKRKVRRRP